jgi:hypothetical protein
MPKTPEGINNLLTAFNTNINANSGALATKYNVTAAELLRIAQATLVWTWFMAGITNGRKWTQFFTAQRDMMETAEPGAAQPLPGLPTLPPLPMLPTTPPTPALLEPGFFAFFTGLVARIKNAENYDVSDGELLGIEGAEMPVPHEPSTWPQPSVDLTTSGQPEVTCKKGVFQGFTVFLTRPGQPRKMIGFASSRHFLVTETLPAAGTAEIWIFDVQYRYEDEPFGQTSQPISVTVRG